VKLIRTKILLFAILILSIISILPTFSHAEIEIGVLESDINSEIIPENPEPYEDVTIKLTSYATDINKAMIVWQNGSDVVLSGYGKTTYTFKALGPDSLSIIDIKITPSGAINSITKRVIINPSEVVLIWESINGYTPPFYKGKSFPSREGSIKVVALPNTNTIKSSKGNVVYTWKSNGNTALNSSGYGKDSFVFKNSLLKEKEIVGVTASSINGTYNAKKEINIPIVSPKIIFYKKSPSEGVLYNQAIAEETEMIGGEMTLVAVPYFLSFKDREDNFNYSWKINDEKIKTPNKKMELTIRPTSRGGYANISLGLESASEIFQYVTGQIKLNL